MGTEKIVYPAEYAEITGIVLPQYLCKRVSFLNKVLSGKSSIERTVRLKIKEEARFIAFVLDQEPFFLVFNERKKRFFILMRQP